MPLSSFNASYNAAEDSITFTWSGTAQNNTTFGFINSANKHYINFNPYDANGPIDYTTYASPMTFANETSMLMGGDPPQADPFTGSITFGIFDTVYDSIVDATPVFTSTVTFPDSGSGSGSGSSGATTPGAPTNAVGTYTRINGQPKLSIKWDAPADKGGPSSFITSYNIGVYYDDNFQNYVNTHNSEGMVPFRVNGSYTSYTSLKTQDIPNQATVYYSITATNQGGLTSEMLLGSANMTSIGTPGGSAPSAPTSVTGTVFDMVSFKQLSLSWTYTPEATQYTFNVYTDATKSTNLLGPVTLSQTGTFTGAGTNGMMFAVGANAGFTGAKLYTNGSSIYYSVTATNQYGSSTESTGTLSVLAFTPPNAPTNVVGIQRGTNIDVVWTAPTIPGTFPVLQYTIDLYTGTNTTVKSTRFVVDAPTTSFTIPDITAIGIYTITLYAISSAGESPKATSNTVSMVASSLAPTNVVATAGNNCVYVNWGHPTSGPPASYYVSYIGAGSSQTITNFSDLSAVFFTTARSGPLVVGTQYQFTVDAQYTGAPSVKSYAKSILAYTLPGEPVNLTITSSGANFVSLSWSIPASMGGGMLGLLKYYTVYAQAAGATYIEQVTAVSLSAYIDDLQAGHTYTFWVKATNEAGLTGPSSNTVTQAISSLATPYISKSIINEVLQGSTFGTTVSLHNVIFSDICPALGNTAVDVIAVACRDGGTVSLSPLTANQFLYIPLQNGSVTVTAGGTNYVFTFYNNKGTPFVSINPGNPGGVIVGSKVYLGNQAFIVGSVGSVGMTAQSSYTVCFLGDAPVLTPDGYRRIDSLRVGDIVRTADGQDTAIQRVFKQVYEPGSDVNPFVIPAGRFGATERLLISPDHHVAVNGAMVMARDLGLQQKTMTKPFTYYNLELPTWKNMVIAGVEVESLAPKMRVRMTSETFTEFLKMKGLTMTPDVRQAVRLLRSGSVEVQCYTQNRC